MFYSAFFPFFYLFFLIYLCGKAGISAAYSLQGIYNSLYVYNVVSIRSDFSYNYVQPETIYYVKRTKKKKTV